MGLLDLHSEEANASVENPVEALPSTLSERLSGSAGEIFGPGRYFNMTGAQRDGWQQTIDQLQTATGVTHLNPYGPVTPEEMGRLGNQPAITAERQQKIVQARNEVLHASGVDAGIADPQEIDRNIGAEQERREQMVARLQGTGNGFGNFLGSMAMSSIEPVNAIGLLLPVGRMGTAAASAVGKTWLGEVAKEAGVQGAFNASLSAMTEGLDYATKETTGQPHSVVDSAGNVVQGAVFGAILGASVRGLHLMWTGLPPEVRAKAPTEVKDAFRVIENDTLYSGDNRLGIDPLLHDRYTANAADPVMRGRAPTIDDLRGSTGGMDTPMTALGTILQQAPESRTITEMRPSPAGMSEDLTRYEQVGTPVHVADVLTPKTVPEGKRGSKGAYFIDPSGRIIDISDIGHPEANSRLNKLFGEIDDEGSLFYGSNSPIVRVDATHFAPDGSLHIGVNAYEGGVTREQKRTIDAIERQAKSARRKGEPVEFIGEVSSEYAGGPVAALGDVKIKEPQSVEHQRTIYRIRAAGADRLRGALDRVRHLPDSELEPLLRETKPAAFAHLEDIQRREADLAQREQAAHDEMGGIGLEHMTDVDTGARLEAIEADLKRPGLRAAERADLERERDMVTQSVDQGGKLTSELEATRKEFFPEQHAEIEKIAAEREALERERKSAQSVLKTEVDQLRSRVEKLTPERLAKGETGFETQTAAPATVPEGAVKKADLERQATAPFRAMTPGELRGAVTRSERTRLARANDIPPDTTPQFDTTVREEGKRVEDLTPQELQKMADDTLAVLAKPGALGPMREGAMRDLELADLQMKDAAKVASCVMGAPL